VIKYETKWEDLKLSLATAMAKIQEKQLTNRQQMLEKSGNSDPRGLPPNTASFLSIEQCFDADTADKISQQNNEKLTQIARTL
jgi:hypothetical protein